MVRKKQVLVVSFMLAIYPGILYSPVGAYGKENKIYFPRFSCPTKIWVVNGNKLTPSEGLLLQSLMGLLAKNSSPGERLYISQNRPIDQLWLKEMEGFNISVDTTTYWEDPWGLIVYLKNEIEHLNGYLAFDAQNESANVVMGLAGIYKCLAVDGLLEPKMEEIGLAKYTRGPGKGDVSAWTESDALEQDGESYNPRFLFELPTPGKAGGWNWLASRDYAVAVNGFCFWTGKTGHQREEWLEWSQPDTMKIGYGPGGESVHVSQASRRSVGTLPVGGGVRNLTVHSAIPVPKEELWIGNHVTLRDLVWQDKHYACFIHSDGDNIGWSGRGMLVHPDFWLSKYRGEFNVGWASSPNLSELMPLSWRYYLKTATNKRVDGKRGSGSGTRDGFFIDLGCSYIYPDIYGVADWEETPNPSLTLHAQRLASAMRWLGLNVVGFMVLERKNYTRTEYLQPFVDKCDRLAGILMKTYHGAYKEHAGNLYWLTSPGGKEIPVEYVDYALWEGWDTPGQIVQALNKGSTDPTKSEAYSLVNCHPWSWGTMENINTIIDSLDEKVCVVTPEEYCMLMRLRFHPKEVLGDWLFRIDEKLAELSQTEAPTSEAKLATTKAVNQYKIALENYKGKNYKDCFSLSKTTDRLTEIARLSYLNLSKEGNTLMIKPPPKPVTPLFYYDLTEICPEILPVKQYQLQVSRDPKFSNLVIEEYITASSYRLPDGVKWIRVRAQGRSHGDWGKWVELKP